MCVYVIYDLKILVVGQTFHYKIKFFSFGEVEAVAYLFETIEGAMDELISFTLFSLVK